jgi:hypothetical protein
MKKRHENQIKQAEIMKLMAKNAEDNIFRFNPKDVEEEVSSKQVLDEQLAL